MKPEKDYTELAILGAGNIGVTIQYLMKDRMNCHMADIIEQKDVTQVDLSDFKEVKKFIHDKHVVVSALPYYLNAEIAKACRDTRTAYFDLTEDVEVTQYVKDLAEDSEVIFMPQCGLAPGVINVIGNRLSKEFDEVHSLGLKVGALPKYPTNSLLYYLSWNTEGVVNEYIELCDTIYNGEPIKAIPMEGLEHITIEGTEYEAFNTSGGVGTLCDSLHGVVENLTYKTIRYPGHRDKMRVLLDDLNLKTDRELLTSILNRAIPQTEDDVVVIFAEAIGIKNERLITKNYTKRIYGDYGFTAIQYATASGVVGMLNMLLDDKLPKEGFIRQEDIDSKEFFKHATIF